MVPAGLQLISREAELTSTGIRFGEPSLSEKTGGVRAAQH